MTMEAWDIGLVSQERAENETHPHPDKCAIMSHSRSVHSRGHLIPSPSETLTTSEEITVTTDHTCSCRQELRKTQEENLRLKQMMTLMAENIEDGSTSHALALAQMAVVDQIMHRGDL